MRTVLLILLAALWVALPGSSVSAASDAPRQGIVQGLEDLVRRKASFMEINAYLRDRHAVVEDYCAIATEHRDCLQRPKVVFDTWDSGALRVLSDVLRMEPLAATLHVTLICMGPGTSTIRMQPRSAQGIAMAPVNVPVHCDAQTDEVEVDLVQHGDFRFGGSDAGTAQELDVDFPSPS